MREKTFGAVFRWSCRELAQFANSPEADGSEGANQVAVATKAVALKWMKEEVLRAQSTDGESHLARNGGTVPRNRPTQAKVGDARLSQNSRRPRVE